MFSLFRMGPTVSGLSDIDRVNIIFRVSTLTVALLFAS